METYQAVRTTLAVRKYLDKPVPAEILRHILQAGRFTGSGMNRQPWNFIVIQDKATIRKLAEQAKTGPYIAQAPAAVVVVIEKDSVMALSDGSRAIQSMVLTAWSEGIGSNWVGFAGGLDAVKPLLGIPDDLDVLAILPLGYPDQAAGQGMKKRKPFGEVVHKEKFGVPYQ